MLWAALALASVPQAREDGVLALVREFELGQREVFWYGHARFEHVPTSAGSGPFVAAVTGAMCGNRLCVPDAKATRALAREVFALYGLDPSGASHVDGARARLDGLDLEHRVGFELVSGTLRPSGGSEDLAPDELAELARAGYRLHVASLADYLSTEDDRFTPTLAYLAGLIEFLNAVTEGEDVELGGLLFEREAALAWPARERFELGADARWEDGFTPVPGARVLVVERSGVVRVSFRGAPDFLPAEPLLLFGRDPIAPPAIPGSTLGAPSVLALSVVKLADGTHDDRLFPAPVERVRVVQPRSDGGTLVHEARSLNLFLPREFDLARPFQLELELAPGRYRLNPRLRLGAAASR